MNLNPRATMRIPEPESQMLRDSLSCLPHLAQAASNAPDTDAARSAVMKLGLAVTETLDLIRRAEEAARATHREVA